MDIMTPGRGPSRLEDESLPRRAAGEEGSRIYTTETNMVLSHRRVTRGTRQLVWVQKNKPGFCDK